MIKSTDRALDKEIYYQKDLERELDRRRSVIVFAFPLLVLMFWAADWIFSKSQAWIFLGLRLTIIPIAAALFIYLKSNTSSNKKLLAIALYAGWPAGLISIMIFMNDGTESIYRHGIILVALCSLVFIPFKKSIFYISCLSLYLPFYTIGILKSNSPSDFVNLLEFFLLTAFIVSISYQISKTKDKFRRELADVNSQKANELSYKEDLIEVQSNELYNLQSLSHQFSPNIIKQMELGNFSVNQGFIQADVCAIFICIQGFSDRVLKLENGKTRRIIDMFIEDTLKPLIRRNITIDKFEGDKVLAFSNQPIEQSNYIELVCEAAFEIRDNIQSRQEMYDRLWRSDFHLKFGISTGRVTVGFFGKEKAFQTYSAIGYPLPKAARLTSISLDSKIIIDEKVRDKLDPQKYKFKNIGPKTLKGFEDENVEVLTLEKSSAFINTYNNQSTICPNCESDNLQLEQDSSGFFVFICKDCEQNRYTKNYLKAS
ncbi:MAG: adenylate/guanylate cyclase domain-containing protein [Bdellovibrionales bacterium]|nr:adenylate/guanylate cyclase domain-containing protein [Bdellovibrionales bacterium]